MSSYRGGLFQNILVLSLTLCSTTLGATIPLLARAKGNLKAPSVAADKIFLSGGRGALGGGPTSTLETRFLDSRLGVVTPLLDANRTSALELVTGLIRPPSGTLHLVGLTSVTGSVHYTSRVPLTPLSAGGGRRRLLSGNASSSGSQRRRRRSERRWSAVRYDAFDRGVADGWTFGDDAAAAPTSSCGPDDGNVFLGGPCAVAGGGELRRRFAALAPHVRLRLRARVHFIDAWRGETLYASIDGHVVWLDTATTLGGGAALDTCGDAASGEAKMGVAIDVTLPHSAPNATVAFGARLGDRDPCEVSWGVDDVALLRR